MSGSSNTVGIVAALSMEARALGRAERLKQGRAGHLPLASLADGSLIAVSGMGCEAAARSARALADAGCGALASWGLAGGLDPALPPGSVVVPEMLLFEGAPALNAAGEWRERALRSLAACGAVGAAVGRAVGGAVGGALLTSRHAFVSAAEKQDAYRRTGAVAVDMESYATAEVAADRGLPFLAIRVIVDAAADDVPRSLTAAANRDGRVAIGRLLIDVLSNPRTLAPLIRLARQYGAARRSLCAASPALATLDSGS